MIDDELRADLGAIDAEVRRRKEARPMQPYAAWAMAERMQAVVRQNLREASPAAPAICERSDTPSEQQRNKRLSA